MGEMSTCNFFLCQGKKKKNAAAINPETLKQQNGVRTAGERGSVRARTCHWKTLARNLNT